MDWQQPVALTIVGVTAGVFVWNRLRRPKFSFQRDTHCGCGSAEGHGEQKQSIVFHARRGERPEVIVKMK